MADGEILAPDLEQETAATLDGSEEFVMFDSEEGKRAGLSVIGNYITGDKANLHTTDKSSIVGAINEVKDEAGDLKEDINIGMGEPYHYVYATEKANNYINKYRLIAGQYIDASGNVASASGWYRTDYIDISGNAYVTYSGSVGNSAFYASDKSYLKTVSGGNKVVTVPSGAVYLRVSVAEANLNTAMVSAGTIPLSYDDGNISIKRYAENELAVAFHKNLFDKNFVQANSYINYTNGNVGSATGYNASDYIPVKANEPYTISNLVNASVGSLAFYKSDKVYVSGLENSGISGKVTVTAPSTATYMKITIVDSALGNTQVEHGTNQTYFADYSVKELDEAYYPNRSGHNVLFTDNKANNLIVKSKLIAGYYIDASGVLTPASGWYATPFIYVGDYSALTFSGNPGSFCFYDANKGYVSNSSSNKTNLAVPATAKYLRVSVAEANLNTANVNVGAVALPYDDGYVAVNINDIRKTIIVDKAGSGDYTSLTEAMYRNYNQNCIFIVKAGTYDLITEFQAYFGATVFDNEGFSNAGLPVNNCEVIMDACAIVQFDYTGTNQAVIDIFSPFKIEGIGGVIKGGQIKCSNCRYAIHDDVYPSSARSKSVIDGVYIYYRSDRNVAIGGGLGQSSDIVVQNCYVDTGQTSQGYGVFYHNTQTGQGQSYIKILNNYFTSRIIIEPFGETTKVSKAIVSNNKCHSVEKVMGGEIDNITMVAFNNSTTA